MIGYLDEMIGFPARSILSGLHPRGYHHEQIEE